MVVRERRSGVVVRERRIGVGGSGGLRALTVGTAGVEDLLSIAWVPVQNTFGSLFHYSLQHFIQHFTRYYSRSFAVVFFRYLNKCQFY